MRKLILGATAALAVAAGQAAGQGLPSQSPAPVVPIGQAAPATPSSSPFTRVSGEGAPVVSASSGPVTYGDIVSGPVGPGGRGYTEGSFLLLFLNTATSPVPLATGGPSLGIIGRPGTTSLISETGSDYDIAPGMRFAIGGFLGDGRVGFELNALYLGKISTEDSLGPTSSTVVARPFFDPVARRENARIIASPGAFTGGMAIDQSAQVWGFEANPFVRVANGSPFTMDVIAGFRFFQHTETLNIYDSSQLLAGGVSAFDGIGVSSPAGIVVHDHFGVRNQFYGGQIGAKLNFGGGGAGGLFVDLTGKVAIGGVRQVVVADGSTTLTGGGLVNSATTAGGFFNTGPNIGERSENRFAVLPEGAAVVGYQFSPAFNVFFGYTVMYLSSAARPGDQISRTVVPSQLPTSPGYNNRPVAGVTGPSGVNDSDLWLHGFSFGATISY